MYGMWFRPGSL